MKAFFWFVVIFAVVFVAAHFSGIFTSYDSLYCFGRIDSVTWGC